jgi:arylsulfatase A
VRLTQCYAASAVCSPSRSAILTGRTPHRNGVYTWITEGSEVHLRAGEITLPRLLKEAGYATCHVGKWHLNGKFNDPAQPQPNDLGYEHWMATQNNAAPSHKDPVNFVRNGRPLGKLEGCSASLVVEEAIDWLSSKRDKTKPFFLAVWTHEPHLPIETEPRFHAAYADLAEDFRRHHGNVTQLDHAFGELMKALDATKVARGGLGKGHPPGSAPDVGGSLFIPRAASALARCLVMMAMVSISTSETARRIESPVAPRE